MRLRDEMPELNGATEWLNSDSIWRKDLVGDKLTLIHFWSVSCRLCKTHMPYINKLRDKYMNDLHVISVHMPRSEKDMDIAQVKEVAETHDISQPVFVDNMHILTDAFNNHYVPAYYVFDEHGYLKYRQSGNGGIILLEKRIARFLRK